VRSGLTARVLGTTVVLALIVGAAFTLLLRAISTERASAVLSLQSHDVLASANRLQRLVIDLETGSRGYLLTGEEAFLQPWTAAREAVGNETANLQRLTVVAEQHQLADEIAQSITGYVNDYSVPLVEAARRGDSSTRSVATTAEGKRRVDGIRADFDALETNETRLAAGRDARATTNANQAVTAAAVGLGISVLLTLALAGYLARAVVRPVRRAARMADRLACGDLSARLSETGVGEIGTLEHSFNEMGDSLEQGRDELARLLREQAALRRVATLVAHGEPPPVVFNAVVEEAGEVLGVDGARMLRVETDNSATMVAGWGPSNLQIPIGVRVSIEGANVISEVIRTGRATSLGEFSGPPGSVGAIARERHIQFAVGAPILVQGRIWGVMVVLSIHNRPTSATAEERLTQFTDLVATAIDNSQAREELAASRARLVAASDQARRRIERDLHDGIQQRLVSLALDLRRVEAEAPQDVRAELSGIASGLAEALDDLREIARGIHPAILSEGGLGPALKALARRSAVRVDLDLGIKARLPAATEVAAYYVVAELLTNAAKHARASVVRIEAAHADSRLDIVLEDDGVGGADPARGSGLVGLIDRIEAVGGRITITSPPGEGTRVRVQLPADTS
jgi:signal transduction histidine kinase